MFTEVIDFLLKETSPDFVAFLLLVLHYISRFFGKRN